MFNFLVTLLRELRIKPQARITTHSNGMIPSQHSDIKKKASCHDELEEENKKKRRKRSVGIAQHKRHDSFYGSGLTKVRK